MSQYFLQNDKKGRLANDKVWLMYDKVYHKTM